MSALAFNLFSKHFPATQLGFEGIPSTARTVGSRVSMSPDTRRVDKVPVTFGLSWARGILRAAYHFPYERYGLHIGSELVNTDAFTSLGVICTAEEVKVSLGQGGAGFNVGQEVALPAVSPLAESLMHNNLDFVVKQKSAGLLGLGHERTNV